MKRNVCLGLIILSLVIALGAGSYFMEKKAAVQAAGMQAPCLKSIRCGPSRCPTTG